MVIDASALSTSDGDEGIGNDDESTECSPITAALMEDEKSDFEFSKAPGGNMEGSCCGTTATISEYSWWVRTTQDLRRALSCTYSGTRTSLRTTPYVVEMKMSLWVETLAS